MEPQIPQPLGEGPGGWPCSLFPSLPSKYMNKQGDERDKGLILPLPPAPQIPQPYLILHCHFFTNVLYQPYPPWTPFSAASLHSANTGHTIPCQAWSDGSQEPSCLRSPQQQTCASYSLAFPISDNRHSNTIGPPGKQMLRTQTGLHSVWSHQLGQVTHPT